MNGWKIQICTVGISNATTGKNTSGNMVKVNSGCYKMRLCENTAANSQAGHTVFFSVAAKTGLYSAISSRSHHD